MEGTESLPASGASPFQLHIPSDNVHDVRTIADIVNFFAWQQRQIETRAPERAAGRISSQPALVKRRSGSKRELLNSLIIYQTSLPMPRRPREEAITTDRA